jgi:hypothetical protein
MTWTIDPYAITTVAHAKEHVGIPALNTDHDQIFTRLVNAATAKIESYLDRKVMKRSYTEFQDGRNNDRMLLRNWPADKPTELWVDSSSLFTDVTKKLDLSKFELELSSEGGIGIILLPGNKFARGRRNIKIIYEAGYTNIPAWAEEAALWTVEFLYDMKGDRRVGVTSKGKNSETTNFRGELPEFVANMLDPYRRSEWPQATIAVEAP